MNTDKEFEPRMNANVRGSAERNQTCTREAAKEREATREEQK